MALTITSIAKNVVGSQYEAIADVTFDSSYPDGGELFTPTDIDASRAGAEVFLWVANTMNDATDADNRITSYDYTNETLRLFTAGATEAGTGSDQSAVKVRVMVRYGKASG